MYVLVFVYIHLVSECVQTRRLPPTSPPLESGLLAGGVRGKKDLRCCFYHPTWQLLTWRLGWKDSSSRCHSLSADVWPRQRTRWRVTPSTTRQLSSSSTSCSPSRGPADVGA